MQSKFSDAILKAIERSDLNEARRLANSEIMKLWQEQERKKISYAKRWTH